MKTVCKGTILKRFKLIGFFLLLVMASLHPIILYGQENDFQLWGDLSASYKITKKIGIQGEAGLRTRENTQLLKQYYAETGLNYQISKRYDAQINYRFTDYYLFGKTSIQRLSADLSYDNKWKRLSYRVRVRYQQEWFISNYSHEFTEQLLRTKISVKYNIKKIKLAPYLGFEHFLGLNGKNAFLSTALRISAGVDYPLTKKSGISIAYLVDKELLKSVPTTAFAISVGYKIKLN
jgi:hypothetical protein